MSAEDRELCAMFEELLSGGLTTLNDLKSLGFTDEELKRGGIHLDAASSPTSPAGSGKAVGLPLTPTPQQPSPHTARRSAVREEPQASGGASPTLCFPLSRGVNRDEERPDPRRSLFHMKADGEARGESGVVARKRRWGEANHTDQRPLDLDDDVNAEKEEEKGIFLGTDIASVPLSAVAWGSRSISPLSCDGGTSPYSHTGTSPVSPIFTQPMFGSPSPQTACSPSAAAPAAVSSTGAGLTTPSSSVQRQSVSPLPAQASPAERREPTAPSPGTSSTEQERHQRLRDAARAERWRAAAAKNGGGDFGRNDAGVEKETGKEEEEMGCSRHTALGVRGAADGFSIPPPLPAASSPSAYPTAFNAQGKRPVNSALRFSGVDAFVIKEISQALQRQQQKEDAAAAAAAQGLAMPQAHVNSSDTDEDSPFVATSAGSRAPLSDLYSSM